MICPPAIAGAERFEKWIADRLAGHPVRLQIEIGPAEPAALHQRLGELDCRLLAIEAGGAEVAPIGCANCRALCLRHPDRALKRSRSSPPRKRG